MKKTFFINTITVVLFFVFEPLLEFCGKLANTYSLGAEIVLGMAMPVLFIAFVLVALSSAIYSLCKCFVNKNIKYILPVFVLVVGAIAYVLISTPDSFWVRLVNFYLNQEYLV